MKFKLTIDKGPFAGLVREVDGTSFTIGRDKKNDLVIKDIFVSSQHCLIKLVKGKSFVLFDKSSNGTIVNGRKILKGSVQLGKRVTLEIGPSLIEFEQIK